MIDPGSAMLGGSAISAGASIAGGLIAAKAQKKAMKKQLKYQKDFAQHGISWRVADAKRAGLHPLAALGAQTTSYTPQSVGHAGALGRSIAAAGQQIGRGMSAWAQSKAREDTELDIEYKKLRNLAAYKEVYGAISGAGSTIPGQDIAAVQGGLIEQVPSRVTAEKPGALGMEAGIKPAEMFTRVPSSKHGLAYIPTLTQELTEAMEDNLMFKAPYYGVKLEEYYRAMLANWQGSKSEAHRKFIGFWSKYLPKAKRGYRWDFSNTGYFYQTRLPRTDPMSKRIHDRLMRGYRLPAETIDITGP